MVNLVISIKPQMLNLKSGSKFEMAPKLITIYIIAMKHETSSK